MQIRELEEEIELWRSMTELRVLVFRGDVASSATLDAGAASGLYSPTQIRHVYFGCEPCNPSRV